MSIEENKEIVRRYYEATPSEDVTRRIREGDNPEAEAEKHYRASLALTFAPDCIMHEVEGDLSVEEFIKSMVANIVTFPDIKCTIEDMIAEGDKVATRLTISFTHERPLQGIPATGKQITETAISIMRFANGKVIEYWIIGDRLGIMQQLGVIPK